MGRNPSLAVNFKQRRKIVKKKTKKSDHQNKLSFVYVNSRSLNADTKLGCRKIQLVQLLETHSPDFLIITETWLNEVKSAPVLPGYGMVARTDKATKSGVGGGTCIYRKTSLMTTSPKVVLKLPLCQVSNVRYRDLLIQVVYRSPKQTFSDDLKLYDYLQSFEDSNRVIIGDWNRPSAWPLSKQPKSKADRALIQAFEEMSMVQMIDENTREESILDLVFMSRPELFKNKQVVQNYISDHNVIFFDISAPHKKSLQKRTIYERKKLDHNEMKSDLRLRLIFLPEKINSVSDCDVFANFLHNSISDVMFAHLEKVKKTIWVDSSAPYIDATIRKLVKEKRKAWNNLKHHRSSINLEKFQYWKKAVYFKILKARQKFEEDLATNYNQKQRKFHKYVSLSTQDNYSIGPLMGPNGLVYKEEEMANLMAKYYSNSCTPSIPYLGDFVHPLGTRIMQDVKITKEVVLAASKKLKAHKSPSHDGLTAEILVFFMQEIIDHFTILFQQVYQWGYCIEYWLTAMVIPLLKPGKPVEEPGSLRPISVTPITYKWFEFTVYSPWLDFLAKFKLLPTEQHGATPNKSVMTSLVHLTTTLTKYYEEKLVIFAASLDQARAFDSISTRSLIEACLEYGMPARAARVLNSMLSRRKIVVKVGQEISGVQKMSSGILQGAIVSPGLYCAAFASVLENLQSQAFVYVDDLLIIRPFLSEEDKAIFLADLNRIDAWCRSRSASIATEKSSYLEFGNFNGPSLATYQINSVVIPRKSTVTYLGVELSENLSLKIQLNSTVSKMAKKVYQVRRGCACRSTMFLSKIWSFHIAPLIEAWAILIDIRENHGLLHRLTKIQKWFFGKTVFSDVTAPNGIIKRIKYLRLAFMYKMVHKMIDIPASQIFTESQNPTRLGKENGLLLPKIRTQAGKRVFGSSIVGEWMAVPAAIRACPYIATFKAYLKTKHPPTRQSRQLAAAERFDWAEQIS